LQWVKRLPFGIIVIIFLRILSLLVSGSASGVTLLRPGAPSNYNLLHFALSLLSIVVVFGLLRLRRWAWVLVMIQLGMVMALDLALYFVGSPQYASMLISVVTVFYLNQSEVQDAFRRRAPEENLT
jgi:hypothetical protein